MKISTICMYNATAVAGVLSMILWTRIFDSGPAGKDAPSNQDRTEEDNDSVVRESAGETGDQPLHEDANVHGTDVDANLDTSTPFGSDELRIILLGKCGNGKSATGNTLLGHPEFRSNTGFQSITSECEIGISKFRDCRVVVIDSPGFANTHAADKESPTEIKLAMKIMDCIQLSLPGPHVFGIVLKAGARYTAEDKKVIQDMIMIFGEDILSKSILLFTRGDELEKRKLTLDNLLHDAPEDLQRLRSECNDRIITVNNNAANKDDERRKILQAIFDFGFCKEKYYSNELLEKCTKTYIEEMAKSQQPPNQWRQKLKKYGELGLKLTQTLGPLIGAALTRHERFKQYGLLLMDAVEISRKLEESWNKYMDG